METYPYEVHIAIPEIPHRLAKAVLADFRSVGIEDYDYFHSLVNLPYDGQPCNIDPTTHDVESPMIITTTACTKAGAMTVVNLGMRKLQIHGIVGANFELEASAGMDGLRHPAIEDFGDFTQQEGSPNYELHVMCNGSKDEVPEDEEMIERCRELLGYPPNQFAAFALTPPPELPPGQERWHVITIYFDTRKRVTACADYLEKRKDAFSKKTSVFAEQICVVSDPN